MQKCTKIWLFLLIAGILLFQFLAIPALANELWVSLSEAGTTLGNRGATSTGFAHLAFGVLDNMTSAIASARFDESSIQRAVAPVVRQAGRAGGWNAAIFQPG